MHTDVDACDCTWGLYGHGIRVGCSLRKQYTSVIHLNTGIKLKSSCIYISTVTHNTAGAATGIIFLACCHDKTGLSS